MRPPIDLPVTWHRQDVNVPGVIIRVASTGTLFWFRTETGDVYRATTAIDGRWREDSSCWPVTLGVATAGARPGSDGLTGLDRLFYDADRVEPWLLKRRWYPMTYMMIPGVKSSAQQLVEKLEHWVGSPEEVARAKEKGANLRRLLAGFKRIR